MRSSLFRIVERTIERRAVYIFKTLIISLVIGLWIPIIIVSIMSFAQDTLFQFPPKNLTLKWYFEIAKDPQAINVIMMTLKVSLVATPLTVIFAVLTSFGLSRYTFRGKNAINLLVTLPLIVPLIVTGVGLALFFGILDIGGGYFAIVLAHVVRTIPFATLVILPTLIAFDKRLEEAAMDLGSNEFQTFRKVTLPNIIPGIIAGGLLAFTISINEFIYTYFVRATGSKTIPVWLWNRIRYSLSPKINAISVIFLVIALSLVLISVFLTRVDFVISE